MSHNEPREYFYDTDTGGRSSSQTPPPARAGRTRRYATQRSRGTGKEREHSSWDEYYISDAESDFMGPPQPMNTHQLLDKLLATAANGILRGQAGSRLLHSSLLLIRSRLDAETLRATEAETRAAALFRRAKEAIAAASDAKAELASTRESLRAYEVQLAQAQAEVRRAQQLVDELEQAREAAESQAADARSQARQAKLDHAVLLAREEGRKTGIEEGFRKGRHSGFQRAHHVDATDAVASESGHDTTASTLPPSTAPNSVVTRVSFRPYSMPSTAQQRPRRGSESSSATLISDAPKVSQASAFLLRPVRKSFHASVKPTRSPEPILVPATPPTPASHPKSRERSGSQPPRPASAPLHRASQAPSRSVGDQSQPARANMTATSSEVERESTSHEGTTGYVPNSSSSESAPPTIISPPPPRASSMQPHIPRARVPQLKVSTGGPSVTFQDTDDSSRYLLPPRVFMPGPESPNSLPPVTPASLTSAPAIYSPMPITPLEDARLAHFAERVPSPRANSPISQAKAAVRARQTQPATSAYDQSFSPWSFIYSPTVSNDMRSPVAVHAVRVSPTSAPVSAPMSEIDLVKRPPPPAGQASQAHPVLKRVNTLRDLLGDEIMEAVSRRGTPVEDGKPRTTEWGAPLGPRHYHDVELPRPVRGPAGATHLRQESRESTASRFPPELASRGRTPLDWFKKQARPAARRAETSGTIPIAVHSPTETMTIPSNMHSPPGGDLSPHSHWSEGLLSPRHAEHAVMWPPDPDSVFAAAVSAVSESPLMSRRELRDEDDEEAEDRVESPLRRWRDSAGQEYADVDYDWPRDPALEVYPDHGPVRYLPIRTGPDYFSSALERIPIAEDRSRTSTPEQVTGSRSGHGATARRSRDRPSSATGARYMQAQAPSELQQHPDSPWQSMLSGFDSVSGSSRPM